MCALEIYIDLRLKDALIDYLFEKGFDDFFYMECYKYATSSLLLSEKEQVSGRKDYAKFKLFLSDEMTLALSQALRNQFASIKLFYSQVHEL
ncbi:DUF3240 family protein [Helicobacter cetorum]|uniref:DUF3240 domain-containing protein n=1 Tax=Helicobacter cetorum (strain ATCC BAA-540 / CCUG 52418 / MIT 99-5656) TaxID=1163745 RepID=I0ETR7_HELCM|nr:DUF3240 family protein [Helicobacter cetorum]AFI06336.1 hypothetical protein HCD_06685 [Helicobacter cetorum MIT 99-5656]